MKKIVLVAVIIGLLVMSGCDSPRYVSIHEGMTLEEVKGVQGRGPNQVFLNLNEATITWIYIEGNGILRLTFRKAPDGICRLWTINHD